MDLKKLAPWNWFRNEDAGVALTVQQPGQRQMYGLVDQMQQEMDQLFDDFLNGFSPSPFKTGSLLVSALTDGILKPSLDIGATEKEYTINIEVPGVDQKDIKLEIIDNTLTVSGEKKQEKEEKKKNYYRSERSYGSFQRILSLPEDADQKKIKAAFKNGVLTMTLPRKPSAQSEIKQIEIQ